MYYVVALCSFLIYVMDVLIGKENNKAKQNITILGVMFVSLYLFVIASFRDISIGIDTENYRDIFYHQQDVELGFIIFSNLVKFFGGDLRLLLILFFLASYGFKLYSFLRMSMYVFLSIAIYSSFWFLVYEMNGIRQGLALGFVALSYYFLKTDRKKKYFLAVAGAILFHYSAWVFLPMFFFVQKKCTRRIFWSVFLLVLIFSVLGISDFVLEQMSVYAGLDIRLIDRALSYQQNQDFNQNILYSFSTLVRLILLFTTYLFIDRVGLKEKEKRIFLWAALLNVSIYLLFSQYEIIATRLSLYYRFGECIFLAYLPVAFKGKLAKILIGFLLWLYVVFQIAKVLEIPNNGLEPYKLMSF